LDQAHLHGVLNQLYTLGISLLSIEALRLADEGVT
jgi:hypothetical protein